MMKTRRAKLLTYGGGLLVAGGLGFLVLTSPWTWSALRGPVSDLPALEGANLENGRLVFVASDCATCHATPGGGKDTLLGGGRKLDTPFGVFHMPNVSPDKATGIGNWTLAEFARALRQGVGPGGLWPDGQNMYPAFPYTSYQRLKGEDVRDLYAYMMSLTPVNNRVPAHELKFPFNIRRGIGVWRLFFLDGKPFVPTPAPDGVNAQQFHRGQYLVEGAAHCAECHSPRTPMGNVLASKRFGGGLNPEGTSWFPNISPDETGIGFWSTTSIARYLHTGVSPIGRAADGDMAEVIANTSRLPMDDLQAMAVYLKHIKPVDQPAPGMPEPNRTTELVMLKTAMQSKARMPMTDAAALIPGSSATVVQTKEVWLDENGVGNGEAQGKLLGGAQVQVGSRNGDKLALTLKGWQMADAPSIIYQARGQRVMLAVLADQAVEKVQHGTPEKDAETEQVWTPVELTVWANPTGMNASRSDVWAYSKDVYQKSCSACHVLPQQGHFTANQWIGTLNSMRRFTSFSDDQYRLVLAYLQNHSKDLNEGDQAAPAH